MAWRKLGITFPQVREICIGHTAAREGYSPRKSLEKSIFLPLKGCIFGKFPFPRPNNHAAL